MNILAFDTATRFLCLGVYKNGRIYESNLDLGIRHSNLIIPKIKQVLARAGITIKDIDYLAVGIGPGSFTGMRIALSTAKGLALGLGKPVIGISTLDILARNTEASYNALVCPIVDARRSLIYCAMYKGDKRVSPYLLINYSELISRISKYKSKVIFLGDALSIYQKEISHKIKDAVYLGCDLWYPKAGNMIKIACDRIANKKFDDAFKLKPIYLYPKECQIKR